jgi:hypothetical protein
MILFDFLFYYLTMWFSTAKTKQLSSPSERASYALGISLLLYVMGINYLFGYFLTKSLKATIPIWICMLIGLGICQLFQYLYIDKGRYEFIKDREVQDSKFKIPDKNGMIISVIFSAGGLLFIVLSVFITHFIAGDY